MGKDDKKIHAAVRELARTGTYEIYHGKVKAADQEKATIDVEIDQDVVITGVRLRAVVTDKTGLWVLPKVNSHVIVSQIEGGVEYNLVRASELDKVFIKIGDHTLEISAAGFKFNQDKLTIVGDQFKFNNGGNGGVPKSASVAAKLNALEAEINILKGISAAIAAAAATFPSTPVLNSTLGTLFASFLPAPLVPTTPVDLANPKVQH